MSSSRSRCEKCGAFLPERFIFAKGQKPDYPIKFDCRRCGQSYELVPVGEAATFIGQVEEVTG